MFIECSLSSYVNIVPIFSRETEMGIHVLAETLHQRLNRRNLKTLFILTRLENRSLVFSQLFQKERKEQSSFCHVEKLLGNSNSNCNSEEEFPQ
ncbi:hypothetical protein CEXT_590991 [Caerostris extrusa]|uniref:Uncharacterized protein n=1 Tax=Caerostris extrusa TaxID=172846 RepID=A0AAV4SC49_CAEEX|nr:hypothetical protein CEXT_590991 [Caerostris extrusa]